MLLFLAVAGSSCIIDLLLFRSFVRSSLAPAAPCPLYRSEARQKADETNRPGPSVASSQEEWLELIE